MRSTLVRFFQIALTLTCVVNNLNAQTVGVLRRDPSLVSDGYRLLAPVAAFTTYLIDNEGYAVRTWQSDFRPGQAAKLMPGGRLLRTAMPNEPRPLGLGGSGGILEEFDWSGQRTWYFELSDSVQRLHHDVAALPNGNVLALVWERVSRAEMIERGRHPDSITTAFVANEVIVEIRPTRPEGGEVVWRWSALDHVVQDLLPEAQNFGSVQEQWNKIDCNAGFKNEDWLHTNSVRYNAERNEIAVSIRNLSELIVINKSTGGIVYRWGNPRMYGRGTVADQRLWLQHNVNWIQAGRPGAGNIIIFSNNLGKSRMPPFISSVEEITPPLDAEGNYISPIGLQPFGPTSATWRFDNSRGEIQPFYAPNVSGAERLPNGNTLISLGNQGVLHEVTADSVAVWTYQNPHGIDGPVRQGEMPSNTMIFNAPWYAAQGEELAERDLKRMGRIEDGPLSVRSQRINIANPVWSGGKFTLDNTEGPNRTVHFYDLLGRRLGEMHIQAGTYIQTADVPPGTWFHTVSP